MSENDTTDRALKDTASVPESMSETGAATPVIVRPKRAASAKSGPRSKARPAKTDGDAPPRSRKAPAKKAASKAGPRSRRAPRTRDEASIPPTWSDLDERGDRITLAEATPLEATLPSRVPQLTDDALDLAPPLVGVGRPWLSPYAKAVAGLAAVVCLVLAGRGLTRLVPRPMMGAASLTAMPPAIIDATPDTLAPPTDTLTEESAEDDKRASLAALEHGKLEESIAAGERATELDPTDADAWLILGAAYQDQGNIVAARRSYAACTKQATRGEVRECTFLLQ